MNDTSTLENALAEFGLTHTEARLYLAGLGKNVTTVQNLASETHIKRPTVYHALGTLIEKGLVNEKKRGTKTLYAMADPQQIRSLIEVKRASLDAQSKQLDSVINVLAHQWTGGGDHTDVVNQQGVEGVQMVMDIALRCTSKKWDIIAPYHNFLRESGPAYVEHYLATRKFRGITSRTLWEDAPQGRRLSPEERGERNPRLMPWVLHGRFKSILILFDDKIAIFSSHENQSAILITSKDVHALFQALFDGIWEFSESY